MYTFKKIHKILTASLLLSACSLHAADFKVGELEIDHVWARATPAKTHNSAAYLTINNPSMNADRLITASSPVAKTVELHTHIHDNGVMRMRQVPDITLPAQNTTALKPGGLHIMLIGLHAPLKEHDTFPLILKFERAGETQLTVTVKNLTTMTKPMHNH